MENSAMRTNPASTIGDSAGGKVAAAASSAAGDNRAFSPARALARNRPMTSETLRALIAEPRSLMTNATRWCAIAARLGNSRFYGLFLGEESQETLIGPGDRGRRPLANKI
jgi:hypothetical protein